MKLDQKGTLYEIPALILLAMFAFAIGAPIYRKGGIWGLLQLTLLLAIAAGIFWGAYLAWQRFIHPSKRLESLSIYLAGVAVHLLFGAFILGILDRFLFVAFSDLDFNWVTGPEGLALLAFSLWRPYSHAKLKTGNRSVL